MLFSLPVTSFILLWEVYLIHENMCSQTVNNSTASLSSTNLVTEHQQCYICYSINIHYLCINNKCVAKVKLTTM